MRLYSDKFVPHYTPGYCKEFLCMSRCSSSLSMPHCRGRGHVQAVLGRRIGSPVLDRKGYTLRNATLDRYTEAVEQSIIKPKRRGATMILPGETEIPPTRR